MDFIDFHTHNRTNEARPLSIASYSLSKMDICPQGQYYTVGLHPWETERLDAYRLVDQMLTRYLQNEYCLAVGEVGLDRLRGASLNIQKELLEVQLIIAERSHKPIVIHCVRAWSELFSVFRRQPYTQHKAIHGYRSSLPILARLLEEEWYISIGFNTPNEIISQIPLKQLLLESDDSNQPISALYERVASLLHESPEMLQSIVTDNIRRFINTRE